MLLCSSVISCGRHHSRRPSSFNRRLVVSAAHSKLPYLPYSFDMIYIWNLHRGSNPLTSQMCRAAHTKIPTVFQVPTKMAMCTLEWYCNRSRVQSTVVASKLFGGTVMCSSKMCMGSKCCCTSCDEWNWDAKPELCIKSRCHLLKYRTLLRHHERSAIGLRCKVPISSYIASTLTS